MTAWYLTSLATLFLNKIILSRPNSSVHVLGMCQMTTAAVLGGWSAFGIQDFFSIQLYLFIVDADVVGEEGVIVINAGSWHLKNNW